MKPIPQQSEEKRSLADTQIEGFRFFLAPEEQSGRGCVLQIFPASPQAEMFRLNSRRTLIGRELSCDIALDDNAGGFTICRF